MIVPIEDTRLMLFAHLNWLINALEDPWRYYHLHQMIEVGIGKCTGSSTAETIVPIEDTRLMVATFNYNHCQLTSFFGLVHDVDEVIYGYVLLDVIITANCVFMCVHCHPVPPTSPHHPSTPTLVALTQNWCSPQKLPKDTMAMLSIISYVGISWSGDNN